MNERTDSIKSLKLSDLFLSAAHFFMVCDFEPVILCVLTLCKTYSLLAVTSPYSEGIHKFLHNIGTNEVEQWYTV